MAGSVHGITPQPLSNNQGPEGPNIDRLTSNIETAISTFNEVVRSFDDEAQGVSRSQIGLKNKNAVDDHSSTQKTDSPTGSAAEIWAAAASEADSNDTIKKKKKKTITILEKKMAEMEALEGMIDETQVEEEERGIIKEFFKNMSTLRQLKRKLKEIDQQKEYYTRMLEQEKRRQNQ